MSCKHFDTTRKRLIKKYYYEHLNTLKFRQLMNTENETDLKKLCRLIIIINEAFNNVRTNIIHSFLLLIYLYIYVVCIH